MTGIARSRREPGKKLSRLSKGFSLKQLGPADNPVFKGKAAEARHMFPWVVGLLEDFAVRVEHGAALLAAGRAKLRLYEALRRDSPVLSEARCRIMAVSARQFLRQWKRAHGRCTPKVHYLQHLCAQARLSGNPSFHHTYPDESFHRRVKRAAKTVHASKFAAHVVARLKHVRLG